MQTGSTYIGIDDNLPFIFDFIQNSYKTPYLETTHPTSNKEKHTINVTRSVFTSHLPPWYLVPDPLLTILLNSNFPLLFPFILFIFPRHTPHLPRTLESRDCCKGRGRHF